MKKVENDRTPEQVVRDKAIEFFEAMYLAENEGLPVGKIIANQINGIPSYQEIFDEIDLELNLMKPTADEKKLSVSGAFFHIKDEHIFEYLNDIEVIEIFLDDHKPVLHAGEGLSKKDSDWIRAYQSLHKLKDYANGEFYDRIQGYRHDLERAKTG